MTPVTRMLCGIQRETLELSTIYRLMGRSPKGFDFNSLESSEQFFDLVLPDGDVSLRNVVCIDSRENIWVSDVKIISAIRSAVASKPSFMRKVTFAEAVIHNKHLNELMSAIEVAGMLKARLDIECDFHFPFVRRYRGFIGLTT